MKRVIATAADLRAARAERPGVVVSAEGGDFLDGDPDRVDEAYERVGTLRHLQLTHYRVNELGDIQTEDPVHGGLTEAGAAVIRRCNVARRGGGRGTRHARPGAPRRRGHHQAAGAVAHLAHHPAAAGYTRLITPEHAKLVAGTGGVIGIWPVAGDLPRPGGAGRRAWRGWRRWRGVEHVGLGTDQMGLVGAATFEQLRSAARPHRGAAGGRVRARTTCVELLGGNYARVFAASMAAA